MTGKVATLGLMIAALALCNSNASSQGSWTCSAPGLQNSSYSGGDTAYIHLAGFNSGNNYPVTKKGKVASGVTKNGTRFTCRQS